MTFTDERSPKFDVVLTGGRVMDPSNGLDEISEADLSDRYRTHCDPRLNANQAIEMAFLIADELKQNGH